jgi:hypothetical protein
MSDGPHRSLPMRRHWRDAAERAAKRVHSEPEVCEAIVVGLKRDILGAPIESVREVLDGRRPDLFQAHIVAQLEALRSSCRGSASANVLIDCAVEATQIGATGHAAVQFALKSALEENMQSAFRGMNEHYQREAKPKEAVSLRARLDVARQQIDCGLIAHEILSSQKPPPARSTQLQRHRGLDDGPERP